MPESEETALGRAAPAGSVPGPQQRFEPDVLFGIFEQLDQGGGERKRQTRAQRPGRDQGRDNRQPCIIKLALPDHTGCHQPVEGFP